MATHYDTLQATIATKWAELKALEQEFNKLKNIYDTKLKNRILALEKRKNFKPKWKEAVDLHLFDNISSICKECYPTWLLDIDEDEDEDEGIYSIEKLGKPGSRAWDIFIFTIIETLHERDSLYDADDKKFNTCEDTAGGCDEIIWEVGSQLLREGAWMDDLNSLD
jgi:hypothetical protein